MNETQLLERARQFDEEALGLIYDQLSPALYAYAFRLLGDVQQAEECVSETFYRLLKALQAGNGPQSFLKAFLYRTAHNWIVDQYRRNPRTPEPLDEEMAEQRPGPEQQASLALEQAEVRTALGLLTPDQRQVIVLKYYQGLENEQIAAAVNKPVGAVKSLQQRGLAALRRALGEKTRSDYENSTLLDRSIS